MSDLRDLSHRLVPMSGRNADAGHRSATPLELLFDLTFVIAFGAAANELGHALTVDHVAVGVVGFLFASFAVAWAWVNFTWFASAYDTDDWLYRLNTLVQMVGVLILALGVPDMFASLEEGAVLDNRVMVVGYVVMRVPMVFQWLRASRQDPDRRDSAYTYVVSIVVAQTGWVILLLLDLSIVTSFLFIAVLLLIELAGPVISESRFGGTPWHPQHMAERYGLLVIIALGEGLIGTMASLTALVGPQGPGWTVDFALVGLAGVAMVFGMWWAYFVIPSGELLAAHRRRSFGWGYGQMPLLASVVAVGAGLHVAAYYLEHHTELGIVATILASAVPLAIFTVGSFLLIFQLTRQATGLQVGLAVGSVGVILLSVLLAAAGASMGWCLLVLALSPWVTVVGYERWGYQHHARLLAELDRP